ncbi:MAG: hypothetical protein JWN48_3465 [Myxococcaceae bacterium]|nr:hypothetical protein [Myxococcaceae bacterium]
MGKLTARVPPVEYPQLSEHANTLLDRALALGSMSASTKALLELTRRDDAEVGPVVEALGLNANLSVAVLRVANSAGYGQARRIADLHRAVTVVGMQELHDLVAGTAMLAAFSQPHPLADRLQASAVLSAAIAQKLTLKLHLGASSTAYLSGLMCELGALACIALDPEYPPIYEAHADDPRARFEQESVRYGGTTPVIGARILSMSLLPTSVTQAVATTGFEPDPDKPPLGRVIAFARLAAAVLVQASEHGDAQRLQDELTAIAATVGLQELTPERLTRTCIEAATSAELTLRGELALKLSAPPHDQQAAGGRAGFKRGPGTGRAYLTVAALAAAAAAAATAMWWLRR